MNPEQIVAIATGTAGLTAFLIFLNFRDRADHQKQLADERARHEKELADVRAQRDAGLVDNRTQTTANERLADAFEKLVTGNATLTAAVERLTRSRPKT